MSLDLPVPTLGSPMLPLLSSILLREPFPSNGLSRYCSMEWVVMSHWVPVALANYNIKCLKIRGSGKDTQSAWTSPNAHQGAEDQSPQEKFLVMKFLRLWGPFQIRMHGAPTVLLSAKCIVSIRQEAGLEFVTTKDVYFNYWDKLPFFLKTYKEPTDIWKKKRFTIINHQRNAIKISMSYALVPVRMAIIERQQMLVKM